MRKLEKEHSKAEQILEHEYQKAQLMIQEQKKRTASIKITSEEVTTKMKQKGSEEL